MDEVFVVRGTRKGVAGGGVVFLNGKELPLHLDKCNHSPTGFNWGYGGSGPAQLAFCIVYEYLKRVLKDPDEVACNKAYLLHQDFKWEFIAGIHKDEFEITQAQIQFFISRRSNNG